MPERKDTAYVVVEKQSTGVGTFLWGAILGAGIALLFAPRSGEETRRELGGGVRKFREGAEDAVQRVQRAVTGTIEEVREQVNERMDSARIAMEAGREAALRSRADLERRVREAQGMTHHFTGEEIGEEVTGEESEFRESESVS